MKKPITSEERLGNSEILQKNFQINHTSRLYKDLFGLKSLILEFGLKSRRLDVRHPKKCRTRSRSSNSEILQKSCQYNHISRL